MYWFLSLYFSSSSQLHNVLATLEKEQVGGDNLEPKCAMSVTVIVVRRDEFCLKPCPPMPRRASVMSCVH